MGVNAIIYMLCDEKMKYVHNQDYGMASALRDMERNLIEHRNISKFVKYVKGQSYYSDVQEYIAPFDRKAKLDKIEKDKTEN